MIDFEQIENAVVALLQPIADLGTTVVVLPEDEGSQELQGYEYGRLIIAYNDSEFGNTQSTSSVVQEEKVCIVVTIESRKRKGDFSINSLKKGVEALLQNKKLPNCTTPLKAKKFEFANFSSNYWTYEFYFHTNAMSAFTCSEEGIQKLVEPSGYNATNDSEV